MRRGWARTSPRRCGWRCSRISRRAPSGPSPPSRSGAFVLRPGVWAAPVRAGDRQVAPRRRSGSLGGGGVGAGTASSRHRPAPRRARQVARAHRRARRAQAAEEPAAAGRLRPPRRPGAARAPRGEPCAAVRGGLRRRTRADRVPGAVPAEGRRSSRRARRWRRVRRRRRGARRRALARGFGAPALVLRLGHCAPLLAPRPSRSDSPGSRPCSRLMSGAEVACRSDSAIGPLKRSVTEGCTSRHLACPLPARCSSSVKRREVEAAHPPARTRPAGQRDGRHRHDPAATVTRRWRRR